MAQLARALPDRSNRDELAGDSSPDSLATRFTAAASRGEQRRLLDLACGWLTPAAVPAMLAMAHILYHRPWEPVGLWGMGLAAMMLAWTPTDRADTPVGKIVGGLG
ncbi:MAG: hypothetical protein K9N23_07845 [Akkermansiaceae bacterium]|nr:hypothetical protein [Akkermansiaceae bacterium]MCF7731584.1 hypothetical protein [Akkermansiaceae bacterium]